VLVAKCLAIVQQVGNEILKMEPVISRDLTIQTARCLLRCPSVEDIPHVYSATRFAGFNDGMQWEAPGTINELDEPLRESLLTWDEGKIFSFTIADPASNSLLGRIGIRKTDRLDVWNLGFWTHPEHQGKGYMTESVLAILEFGFSRLGAIQIEASYALWNKGSQRVLEKVGMKSVAYIPHAFQKRGHWIEANKTSITKQQWLLYQRL
jgi:[ribosomal protein S5]-alanine N-acetyltransferase